MKSGTHNLGNNQLGQMVIVKAGEGGLRVHVGSQNILLSAEQAKLLKDVLA